MVGGLIDYLHPRGIMYPLAPLLPCGVILVALLYYRSVNCLIKDNALGAANQIHENNRSLRATDLNI